MEGQFLQFNYSLLFNTGPLEYLAEFAYFI